MKASPLIVFFTLIALTNYAQLVTDHLVHDYKLVETIKGKDVRISNVSYIGAVEARGMFENKETPLPLKEGIIISTGEVSTAMGPNKGEGFTGANDAKGDKDLSKLSGEKTFDASVLEFDFVPKKEIIRFYFVFGSDEYREYVNSDYNDVFGFFITDLYSNETSNIGVIPMTNEPITINNINHKKNQDYYIENSPRFSKVSKRFAIEFDGLTKKLVAYHEVIPGRKYHIKIAIADAGDNTYDSAVFLEGGSFTSQFISEFITENKDFINSFSIDTTAMIANIEKLDLPNDEIENESKKTPTTVQPLKLYFDFDQFQLLESEAKKLKDWTEAIDLSTYKIEVTGHTDQKGTKDYNQSLSEKRAKNIKQQLINAGANPNRIQSTGKGFQQLRSEMDSEEGRAQNRRVEITVQPIKK